MMKRIKQILKRFFLIPEISFPKVKLALPSIPFYRIGIVLGAINTTLLVLAGSIGLAASFINQYQIGNVIHWLSPILPFRWENIFWTGAWVNITDQFVFDAILAAQANFAWTISGSIGLIVLGFVIHVGNFSAWWRGFKAAPMAVVRSPIRAYQRITIWRNWLLAKIEYANNESQKWKTTFKILMSPYSLLRALGFSPQMAIGLLAVGSTAGAGVAVNETILAERSFTNGDSGIYAAPAQHPDPTLEQTMAWRQENSGLGRNDNTLRIVLGTTPVREIRIENVSVGTVYSGSAIPSSAHTSARRH